MKLTHLKALTDVNVKVEMLEKLPPEQAREGFFDFHELLSGEISDLFGKALKELKENLATASSEHQTKQIKAYFLDEFSDWYRILSKHWHWILHNAERTKYKDKSRKEIILKPFIGHEIPKAEVDGMDWCLKRFYQEIELLQDGEPRGAEVNTKQVKWNGTQKNLAELFIELERKGWIDKIETGDRAAICRAIYLLFDLSGTKKEGGKETNTLRSFEQTFAPSPDPKTKEPTFENVYKKRYKPVFALILEKKSKKKTT